MLKRITLVNFMSHERTVIEPAAGLTVLVGPNNCGKSAVVAALRILCNNETADYAVRHGAKEAAVTIETDDGHTIEWRRKNSNRYVINDQVFDRLNRQVPEGLHKVLRLPTVDSEPEPFDVHIAHQKEPLFLLDRTDGERAKFFASSSDAALLIEMQKRHTANVREHTRRKKEREEESLKLNRILKTLEPVVDLEARLDDAERLYAELQSHAQSEEEFARQIGQLERADAGRRRFHAVTGVLATLESPPAMAPAATLQEKIESLSDAMQQVAYDQAKTSALHDLPVPPELYDCEKLDALLTELVRVEKSVSQWSAKAGALEALADPPAVADTSSLERWLAHHGQAMETKSAGKRRIAALSNLDEPPKLADAGQIAALSSLSDQLNRAQGERLRSAKALEEAQAEQGKVQAEIVAFAAAHPKCPTCGAEMDAERLMAEAAQGLAGVHHREAIHE